MARVEVRSKPEVRLAARVEDWVSWIRNADPSSATGMAVRHFDAAHLGYARDGGSQALATMLAELTNLEHAVGRSGRTKERVPVRGAPAARDFLTEFTRAGESRELRVAVGIASCATRLGAGMPVRSMRQILLPVDPGDPGQRAGRWRSAPLAPGFGLRPLPQVLADVLIWRSRTAADEQDSQQFRGVPGFRLGVPVPAADLHAFALGLLDEADLDLWLRACLALDWRGLRPPWSGPPEQVPPVPTLGLLQLLAPGLAAAGSGPEAPKLALEPDWAARLAAGHLGSVHAEAAARLRQAGWQAVPFQSPPGVTGAVIAAALVPRCRNQQSVMRCLAVRLRGESANGTETENADDAAEPAPRNPPLAEELS